MTYALVLGAGGFLGGHLTKRLAAEGCEVVCADLKARSDWRQRHPLTTQTFDLMDLADPDALALLSSLRREPFDEVYNLAGGARGVGYAAGYRVEDSLGAAKVTLNVLEAAAHFGWGRLLYASSASVYPAHLQRELDSPALREQDAHQADPEEGQGWEKLFGERVHRYMADAGQVDVRIARYHSVYGPHDRWNDGHERVVASLCRQVAEVALHLPRSSVEVWGDGLQVRSFLYVTDAVEATLRLMRSDVREPLNVGSDEAVTVNALLDAVREAARVDVEPTYRHDAPQGVRARVSDNAAARRLLDWEPVVGLREGVAHLYPWVYDQVRSAFAAPFPTVDQDEEVVA